MADSIFIENVTAHFYKADFNTLYTSGSGDSKSYVKLPVHSFSYAMSIAAVPSCTVTVMSGFNPIKASYNDIGDKLQELTKSARTNCLYCEVTGDVGRYVADTVGSMSTVTFFKGILVSTGLQTNYQVSGSSNVFTFVLVHPYAVLKRWGSCGMLYSDQKTIEETKTLKSLENALDYLKKNSKHFSTASDVVQAMKTAAKLYENNPNPPNIETALCTLIDNLQAADLVDSPIKNGSQKLNLSKFISAKITPRKSLRVEYIHNIMSEFLVNVASLSQRSDLCSTLITACNRPEICLTAVPRSLDKMYIIPQDGIFNEMPTVTIYADQVRALNVKQWNGNTGRYPDGIIVMCGNLDHYNNGGKTTNAEQAGTMIQSFYPNTNGADDKLRWRALPAPRWFSNLQDATGSNTSISKQVVQDLCERYAKTVYSRLAYAENQCSINLTPDCVNIYKCLGQRCKIPSSNASVTFYGVLTSVSVSYRSTPKGNIDVAAGFNYCSSDAPVSDTGSSENTENMYTASTYLEYTDLENTNKASAGESTDMGLYSIDDANEAPNEIPSII